MKDTTPPSFDTLTQALTYLREQGYKLDFNLNENHITLAQAEMKLHPADFEIDFTFRFEGETNPSDSSVLYGISSKDGLKGVLVNAYGVYADTVSGDLAKKLG